MTAGNVRSHPKLRTLSPRLTAGLCSRTRERGTKGSYRSNFSTTTLTA
jgi:hypothetical protein